MQATADGSGVAIHYEVDGDGPPLIQRTGGGDLAAARVIQVAQQQPAPIRVPIGPDAEQLVKAVHEQTDEELDALRMRVAGLGTNGRTERGCQQSGGCHADR